MQYNYCCVIVVFLVNSDLDQWLVKKTLCAPHWTKVLINYIGFNSFLEKEASSLVGRLNYQLILNLRFKGRGSVGFKISARVRQSSMTSNTLWASVNFFRQITIQRYFVFVSTVELRTLYIQKRLYMNTFCEYILKKIGPTHAHFQYSARKLMPSLKSVLLWCIPRES